jgi:hypothetical protein
MPDRIPIEWLLASSVKRMAALTSAANQSHQAHQERLGGIRLLQQHAVAFGCRPPAGTWKRSFSYCGFSATQNRRKSSSSLDYLTRTTDEKRKRDGFDVKHPKGTQQPDSKLHGRRSQALSVPVRNAP